MEENPMEGQSNSNQNAQQQPQVNVNVNNTQTAEKTSGLCIAALVLGIVSLVLWCFWFISVPCAILAFILGLVGLKKPGKGMAIAGVVTGLITAVTWLITFIYLAVVVGALSSANGDINSALQDYMDNYGSSYYNY